MRVASHTRMCSNFRPLVAKTIYDRYLNGGDTLDPSMGYGGRLLGFLLATYGNLFNTSSRYFGVDPLVASCKGNKKMAEFFKSDDKVRIFNTPMEDFDISLLDNARITLAFTSPPYFKNEIYSEDETQSSNRYKDYDSWLTEFWSVVVQKVYQVLQPKGMFVVNIADVLIKGTVYPLVADTDSIAKETGFVKVGVQHIKYPGFGEHLDKIKTEPVLFYQKQ